MEGIVLVVVGLFLDMAGVIILVLPWGKFNPDRSHRISDEIKKQLKKRDFLEDIIVHIDEKNPSKDIGIAIADQVTLDLLNLKINLNRIFLHDEKIEYWAAQSRKDNIIFAVSIIGIGFLLQIIGNMWNLQT